jgi:hypothetical protein
MEDQDKYKMECLEEYLNAWKVKIHEHNVNVGWWPSEVKRGFDEEYLLLEKLQLILTEVAEATEGLRKNLMDDKLPHRKMVEVEIADALIRYLDYGGRINLDIKIDFTDLDGVVDGSPMFQTTEPAFHFYISKTVTELFGAPSLASYGRVFNIMIAYCMIFNYDIFGAMEEKVEFNKTRADHKLENRKKFNGKSF